MLPTLSHQHRTKLESEILQTICNRSNWIYEVEILDAYFADQFCKKVWLQMRELLQTGKEISLVNLSEYFEISSLGFLFNESVWNLNGLKTFIDAVKLLEEEYKKTELNKLFSNSSSSQEVLENAKKLEEIGLTSKIKSLSDLGENYKENYLKRKEVFNKNGTTGLKFDWTELGKIVRFEPSELVIVGARTSIGKTAFCLDFAIQNSFYDQKVLFVTMEMNTNSIIDRLAANITKIHLGEIKKSQAPIDFIQTELSDIGKNLFIVHDPTATTDSIARLANKMKFDLIIVDYLQLLRDRAEKGELETYRIGRIAKALKRIAGERNCVLVTPSQLNRESEKQSRKPTLADLRDSGCIEQDSDVILLIHREDRDSVLTNLIVAKNRNGKSGVEIEMKYSPAQNIFTERLAPKPYAQIAMD